MAFFSMNWPIIREHCSSRGINQRNVYLSGIKRILELRRLTLHIHSALLVRNQVTSRRCCDFLESNLWGAAGSARDQPHPASLSHSRSSSLFSSMPHQAFNQELINCKIFMTEEACSTLMQNKMYSFIKQWHAKHLFGISLSCSLKRDNGLWNMGDSQVPKTFGLMLNWKWLSL